MKYYAHHGGASEDVIEEFSSPVELERSLRARLQKYGCDNLGLIHASNCDYGRIPYDWKHLWLISIDGYGVCGWADSWYEEEINGNPV